VRYPRVRPAAVALGVGVSVASLPAHAQPLDEARARADALFREGQQLITTGQVATACEKLEESQRLDPKLGRLLNVAYCHQQLGRTATAWSEYNQAAAFALQTGQSERETFARTQASELARGLSFVQLDLTAAPRLSQVLVDGRELAREQWALPQPIDPGSHTLTFAAAGHKTQLQTVTIRAPGTVRVQVDPLESDGPAASGALRGPSPASSGSAESSATPPSSPATALPVASTAEQPRTTNPDHTIGWVLGAAGGAALGVGAGFGFRAISLKNEADSMWCTNHQCSPHGLSLIDDARTAGTIATVGVAVGLASVGFGAWLVLRSPAGSGQPKLGAYLLPDRAGVALRGGW